MSRLLLLPEKPGSHSGYQKAVQADLQRLQPTCLDTAIYYHTGEPGVQTANEKYIKRTKGNPLAMLTKLGRLQLPAELTADLLTPYVTAQTYESIFCGEVTLYRAVKQQFPNTPITVRFHNFYSLLLARNRFLGYSLPVQTKLLFYLLTRLEREILADSMVYPIFIQPEEFAFFNLVYPKREAACWALNDNLQASTAFIKPEKPVLVWFGGLSPHKEFAVIYFLQHTWPLVQKVVPGIVFHLFGNGTTTYNLPGQNVFGHGFYEGEGFPFDGKALFINPDLLGGGVKLKIGDWLAHGIPFISTPFGVEGYRVPPNPRIMVEEIDQWPHAIAAFFKTL